MDSYDCYMVACMHEQLMVLFPNQEITGYTLEWYTCQQLLQTIMIRKALFACSLFKLAS